MIIDRVFQKKGLRYRVRLATRADAEELSAIRLKIDGETEHLDREAGEDFLTAADFMRIIDEDQAEARNLFLVCEINQQVIGFLRAKGNRLKRTNHKVDFGIAILKEYWGYSIGQQMLVSMIDWADSTGIRKIALQVLETNESAIALYKKLGFEVEGILKEDKYLSNGYQNTLVMGRIKQN